MNLRDAGLSFEAGRTEKMMGLGLDPAGKGQWSWRPASRKVCGRGVDGVQSAAHLAASGGNPTAIGGTPAAPHTSHVRQSAAHADTTGAVYGGIGVAHSATQADSHGGKAAGR